MKLKWFKATFILGMTTLGCVQIWRTEEIERLRITSVVTLCIFSLVGLLAIDEEESPEGIEE